MQMVAENRYSSSHFYVLVGSICFLLLFVETLRVCNYISHHCYLHIARFYLQFAHQDKLIIVEVIVEMCLCVMMHL